MESIHYSITCKHNQSVIVCNMHGWEWLGAWGGYDEASFSACCFHPKINSSLSMSIKDDPKERRQPGLQTE